MITGRNIICFASNWDYHPTSKHHVMRGLSEHNNIIWVNWHASRRPRVGMADFQGILGKLRQIRHGPRRVSDSITTITPWLAPFPGSSIANRFNAWSTCRTVRRVLAQLPPWPVQIWSFAPDMGHLVGSFGEELVLYYCVDAFGAFPGYDAELIARRERELMVRSDVVITTSPPLFEAKRKEHPNVHFVQHGVDHAHLSRAVSETLACPKELESLPRPIFAFVGVFGDWVDLGLVADLARRLPSASFVMIGPEMTPRGACADVSNVYWLGGREHTLLPQYLQHCDVGLIPFKRVPLTYNANPIKLYEYLAAGVPVVSTPLPAVQPMAGSVWVAEDTEGLVRACEAAARSNDPAARLERSQCMSAESWSARLEQIETILKAEKSVRREKQSIQATAFSDHRIPALAES